jgi:hypothetical protein
MRSELAASLSPSGSGTTSFSATSIEPVDALREEIESLIDSLLDAHAYEELAERIVPSIEALRRECEAFDPDDANEVVARLDELARNVRTLSAELAAPKPFT